MCKIDTTSVMGFFVFCLCLFASGASAGHQDVAGGKNEIFALGKSRVVGGNQAAAKEKAISRALETGLESYLIQMMGRRDLVLNFRRIAGNTLSRGAGTYIKNYNILAEELTGENYWVFVRIRINETILGNSLRSSGVVSDLESPVKVLLMIVEKRRQKTLYWWGDPYESSPMSTSELAFYNAFRQNGFSVVNRTRPVTGVGDVEGFSVPALGHRGACHWGRIFSADIVLRGRAEVLLGEKVSFDIIALSVENCEKLYNASGSVPAGKVPDTERGALIHMEKLAGDMISEYASLMFRKAMSDQRRLIEVVFTLEGLASFKEYKIFRDFLEKDVQGVVSVLQRRVRAGTVSIAVQFRGDNRHILLNRILGHKDNPFKVSVADISEREIKLTIKDNNGDAR